MFKYFIYDEDKQLMRKTRTLQEAKEICKLRAGWNYVYVKPIKPIKPIFEDAPY
jgi:hypothetical protein